VVSLTPTFSFAAAFIGIYAVVVAELCFLFVPVALPRTESSLPGTVHASVQINIGHLDENGLFDGRFTTFGLSRFARAQVIILVADCSLISLPNSTKRCSFVYATFICKCA